MNRLTVIFLVLLALATWSGGIGYQNAQAWLGGGNGLNALAFLISAAVFGFAMLVLGRIIYLTAR